MSPAEFVWCPSCDDRHAAYYECGQMRVERRARERQLLPQRLAAVKRILDEFDALDYRRKSAVSPHALVGAIRAAVES